MYMVVGGALLERGGDINPKLFHLALGRHFGQRQKVATFFAKTPQEWSEAPLPVSFPSEKKNVNWASIVHMALSTTVFLGLTSMDH